MLNLSIIVPVYNGEKYLKKCIINLEKITNIDYEIIVINDGSSDNTNKMMLELQNEYTNIVYINNKENKGVSFSRNIGISQAKGEYIGFADIDDEIDSEMYYKLYNNALKNRADVSVCNYYEIAEKTQVKTNSKYKYPNETLNRNVVLKKFLLDQISPAIWDKLYKKELIKKIQFHPNLAIGEDILFCLNIFSKCECVCFSNENLYGYLQNDNSVMHTISPKHTQFIKILDYISEDLKKYFLDTLNDEYEFFKLQMITRGIHSISNLVNKNNKKQAIDLLKNYYTKQDLKNILKNKYFSKSVKMEIFMLKYFGIHFHLFMMPIYKKIRSKVR